MLLEIIILFLFLFLYFHIYLIFKINVNNEVSKFDEELSKQNITNEIAYKLPFYFNINHLKNKNTEKLSLIKKEKNYDVYEGMYENIHLLEPFVKYFPKTKLYEIKKKRKHVPLECHKHYRNFYVVTQGAVAVTLIHPKYKENFMTKNEIETTKDKLSYIKDSENFKRVELNKNDILFVPNYWIVLLESRQDKTNVELLQYKTILNELCFIHEKYFKDNL